MLAPDEDEAQLGREGAEQRAHGRLEERGLQEVRDRARLAQDPAQVAAALAPAGVVVELARERFHVLAPLDAPLQLFGQLLGFVRGPLEARVRVREPGEA